MKSHLARLRLALGIGSAPPRAAGIGRRVVAVVGVVIAMAPQDARAGGAQAAEVAFEAGRAAFDHKDYAAARREFARAYREVPLPKYLWNLGLSEFRSGAYWSAYGHFAQYKTDPGAARENLAHLDEVLRHTEEHLGHLTVDAPAGFEVTVDGIDRGAAPLPSAVVVDPDRPHDVTADHGASHLLAHVDAPGLAAARVQLAEPIAPPAAAHPSQGSEPVLTTAGQDAKPRSMAGRNITVIALGGLAAASVGVAVGFALNSRSEASTAANLRANLDSDPMATGLPTASICSLRPALADCANLSSATQRQSSAAWTSDGFYIGAGVLAAGALATFLLWPRSSPVSSAWVLPSVSPSSAGVTVGGSL
jgi:hypothetical protein